uniref:Uncharacterized protein n=1 Tax=Nelumbo nucifera TaxID=4432 RepID=A0A822XTY2_NELNU|nr:TPA_asm: hypothetical protein HUJ06_024656 [Nelumbo nucifera]
MSKKKAFSGSTMTLKDFHGGSIPSDLPLPSAPGVIVRPSDRPGFDRHIPTAWGNPIGRSDHRSRPGSSGATRNFDEKASFLSHPAHIGRNFDEDERKPLDCLSVPRRTVSDESLRPPSRPEQKPDSLSSVKFSGSGKQVSSPVSYSTSTAASSFPSRFTGASPVGGNPQPSNASNGSTVSSSSPNAWGMRKEVVGVSEPVPSSAWSGPSAVSKFAQATALEKVSSGRWQSKHPVHHQPDVEVIRLPETEGDFRPKDGYAYNVVDPVSERGDHNVTQGRYTEKGWTAADGIRSGGKEAVDYERARSPIYPEAKERNLSFYSDGVRPASTEGRFVGSQLPPPVPSEVSERPKLKLLPRSKPLETSEPHLVDYKQGHHQSTNSGHLETLDEPCANANSSKPGLTGAEGSNRLAERPKLNLKPRSQPLEQSEGNVERERLVSSS